MTRVSRAVNLSAVVVLFIVVLLGLFGILFVVPATTSSLVLNYAEFRNDFNLMVLLLAAPLVIGVAVLLEIVVLLSFLREGRMLTKHAQGWVNFLVASSLALGSSLALLLFWLNAKNAVSPVVGLVLLVLILVTVAVALVTISLRELLKEATKNSRDLEGVI